MLVQLATLGPLGRLPVVGGLLATVAGLAAAIGMHSLVEAPRALIVVWALLLTLAMLSVPRALAAGTPPRQIVLDRFTGIWLAAAPVLPFIGIATTELGQTGLLALGLPLVIYNLILAGPLRRMGASSRPLLQLADDLIAATLTLLLAIGMMAALIARSGAMP
ncbi:phosphatidylglycerophosphatase A [Tropicimonas aquimaris]|uniref:Phosphatidylglycerophosphatase A n=1 Tax=Tropicimonas aquimaris TaxID=914152 RepID=A0ABW3IP50_9RHOB